MWCRAEVIEHPHLCDQGHGSLQAACDVIDAGFAGVGRLRPLHSCAAMAAASVQPVPCASSGRRAWMNSCC